MARAAPHIPATARSLMTAPGESTSRTCGASGGVTKAGTPCRSTLNLSPTTGRCAFHDPGRVAEVREMRAKGGVAAGRAKQKAKTAQPEDVPAPPTSLDDAVRYFAWITHAVSTGKLDARTGHEAAYSLNGFKAAIASRDIQREMAALQKTVAELKRDTPSRTRGRQ
jgi:hypothetical protein